MSAIPARIAAWTDAEGPLERLGALRIVVGLMLLRHMVPFVQEHARGDFFAAKFHVPYAAWLAVPGEGAYTALLAVAIGSGLLVAAGLWTRVALPVAAATATFHLFLNQVWYSNNKLFLLLLLLLLALSPADRALSADAARRGLAPIGPTWTLTIVRLQASLIYVASAASKLLDADWRSGAVMISRVTSWPSFHRLSPGVQGVIDSGVGRFFLGPVPIALELFIALGLWFATTRRAALLTGVFFHFLIEAVFNVLVFSHLVLGSYFTFAHATVNTHVLTYDPARHALPAALVRAFDWLRKVAFAPTPNASLSLRAFPNTKTNTTTKTHTHTHTKTAVLASLIIMTAGLGAFLADWQLLRSSAAKPVWAAAVVVSLCAATLGYRTRDEIVEPV